MQRSGKASGNTSISGTVNKGGKSGAWIVGTTYTIEVDRPPLPSLLLCGQQVL